MWFFRAVALDLDGTLAIGDQIAPTVLAAIDDARRERAMLLVTGRVRSDLERVFPGLISHFDAVVTENGAVLTVTAPANATRSSGIGAGRNPDGGVGDDTSQTRLLHDPVDTAVDRGLADRNVRCRRGEVLVGIDGADAGVATEVIAELGLDYQVVHNRGAAMILPAGVTKGTGLHAGLEALGLGEHNALAVGDAENDLSLLRAAEVGAAVADAVPSLAQHADLVLDRSDGSGVTELLAGPLIAGRRRLCPPRRWISVGSYDDGTPARVPGSQASVLVTGGSGMGKSYLAGLLAERWIEAGYALLVIDPEGDHPGLAHRAGVHLVDGAAGLPNPHDLLALMRPRQASVVLDLSGVDVDAQLTYLERLPAAVAAERARHGVPHWVLYDEAHQQAWLEQSQTVAIGTGSCLVTWRPELLSAELTEGVDVRIAITGGPGVGPGGQARATLSWAGTTRDFRVGRRASDHVRHQRKYAASPLPRERRFYFHDQDPADTAAAAATLDQFRHQVRNLDSTTLGYHLSRRDFSRWVAGTLADRTLARELTRIERNLATEHAAALEEARDQICEAIENRYLEG